MDFTNEILKNKATPLFLTGYGPNEVVVNNFRYPGPVIINKDQVHWLPGANFRSSSGKLKTTRIWNPKISGFCHFWTPNRLSWSSELAIAKSSSAKNATIFSIVWTSKSTFWTRFWRQARLIFAVRMKSMSSVLFFLLFCRFRSYLKWKEYWLC